MDHIKSSFDKRKVQSFNWDRPAMVTRDRQTWLVNDLQKGVLNTTQTKIGYKCQTESLQLLLLCDLE